MPWNGSSRNAIGASARELHVHVAQCGGFAAGEGQRGDEPRGYNKYGHKGTVDDALHFIGVELDFVQAQQHGQHHAGGIGQLGVELDVVEIQQFCVFLFQLQSRFAPGAQAVQEAAVRAARRGPRQDALPQADVLQSYFDNYCIDCHGAEDQMGGIGVHEIGTQKQMLEQRKDWLRVLKIVQVGAMPPEDIEPRPTARPLRPTNRSLRAN